MTVERFPVEAGHVFAFTRAIGDPNPIYTDEGYARGTEAGGRVAPPTFVIADLLVDPDSRLRPRIGEPWHGSGKNPTSSGPSTRGGGGSGLHAEEHFEFRRPVRVGEVLTKTTRAGERWQREGRRGGKLSFSETIHEYRDDQGDLVVVARQIGVQTERAVDQP